MSTDSPLRLSLQVMMAGMAGDMVADEDGLERGGGIEALHATHYLSLVRLAALMVGDLHTAEEVVQDAFVRTLASWNRIREPDGGYLRSAELELPSLEIEKLPFDGEVVDVALRPGTGAYVHGSPDRGDRTGGPTSLWLTGDGAPQRIVPDGHLGSSTIAVSPSGDVAWVEPGAEDGDSLKVLDSETSTTTRVLSGPGRLASPAFGPGGSLAVLRTTDSDPFAFQSSAELVVTRPGQAADPVRTVDLPDDLPFGFDDHEPRISWSERGLLAVTSSGDPALATRRTLVLDARDGALVAEFDGWYGQAWAPDGTGLLLFQIEPFDDPADDTTVSSGDGVIGVTGTLRPDVSPLPPGPRGTTTIALAYGPNLGNITEIGTVDHFFTGNHWLDDRSPGATPPG